jgi:hypothetical protein
MKTLDTAKKVILHVATEPDGESFCPVRIGTMFAGLTYHVGAAFMIFHQNMQLDMSILGQYIQHMSTLIGVSAAGIGAKSVLKGDAPISNQPSIGYSRDVSKWRD